MVITKTDPQKSKINAAINHAQNLWFLISKPVVGKNGISIAIREAINNATDASCSHIRIKFGIYKGKEALIISDDGVGFTKEGIDSAMSYAFSARKRDDIKTIGANGTGLKSFLGLGEKNDTKLTIFSVHEGIPECTKMEINFAYLLGLAEKTIDPDQYVHQVQVPHNWNEDLKRTTGTTVILTGFDTRKFRGPKQVIAELPDHITPKAATFIKVFDGIWKNLEPKKYDGNEFLEGYPSEYLGNVIFELYYGVSGDGPKICGSINEIFPLTELYNTMSKIQKGTVSKVWKSVSGYIYIEKANTFRTHDGSFSEDFYQSGACEELVTLLALVSEEIEKLTESIKDDQIYAKKEELIKNIIKAAQAIFSPSKMDIVPGFKVTSNEKIYLLPRKLRLFPGEEIDIQLNNGGTAPINFRDAKWIAGSEAITILSSKDNTARVKAGDKKATTKITIMGMFGEHVITVSIIETSSLPFIMGAGTIQPGDTYQYDLKRHSNEDVSWVLKGPKNQWVTLETSSSNKKTASLNVDKNCKDCTVVLAVNSTIGGKQVTQRRIQITNEQKARPSKVIKIGEEEYLLVVDTYFPETIAQVDSNFNEFPISEIVVNPLHPRIKDLSYTSSIDHILAAIANAAIIDQVSTGKVSALQAAAIVEKYVMNMKERLGTK